MLLLLFLFRSTISALRSAETEAKVQNRFIWSGSAANERERELAELAATDAMAGETISGTCVEVVSGDTIVIAVPCSSNGGREKDGHISGEPDVHFGEIYDNNGDHGSGKETTDSSLAATAAGAGASVTSSFYFEEVRIGFSNIRYCLSFVFSIKSFVYLFISRLI